MDPLYKELLWLQWPMASTFLGVVLILWGHLFRRTQFIKWGFLLFILTGISGYPLYYAGIEAANWMNEMQIAGIEEARDHKMDSYATIIGSFFLSITALMSLFMLRAINKVPRLFLYPIVLYAIMLIGFIGWRQLQII